MIQPFKDQKTPGVDNHKAQGINDLWQLRMAHQSHRTFQRYTKYQAFTKQS